MTTEHGGDHEFPYQNITQSQLGHFANAIENATTQSDFEKLENIIKHGQIPRSRHRIEVESVSPDDETAAMMLHTVRDGHDERDDLDMDGHAHPHQHGGAVPYDVAAAPPDPASVIDPAYYNSPYQMRNASSSTKSGYANLPNMESKAANKRNLMVLDEEELERKLHRVANQQSPGRADPGGRGQRGRVLSPSPMFKTVSISPINRTYISDMENLTSQEASGTEL